MVRCADPQLTGDRLMVLLSRTHLMPATFSGLLRIIQRHLSIILNNPFLFAESEKMKGWRKSVLSNQIIIFYKIKVNEVYIISFCLIADKTQISRIIQEDSMTNAIWSRVRFARMWYGEIRIMPE